MVVGMMRNYYLLPADYCRDALAKHMIARDDALKAKKALMDKYGCTALVRRGPHVDGLAYLSQVQMHGFTVPRYELAMWVVKPKKNTIRGKQAIAELAECGELLEIWQWSLEKCLGVYGCVLDHHGFHYLVATPLQDGSVILCAPAGKNRPRGPNVSRNFDDPVIPDCAELISADVAENKLLSMKHTKE
jgi:hypothetical protein